MDSYAFQTVGSELISCYAACMEVPLFQQALVGSSFNQELHYQVTPNDETEDLFNLLSDIKVKLRLLISSKKCLSLKRFL